MEVEYRMRQKYITRLSLLAMFVFPLSVAESGAHKRVTHDPVIHVIGRLQPRLKTDARVRLARALRSVTAEPGCKISWQVLLAVAFNESSLWIDSVNNQTHDHGLMQINEKNVLRLRLDSHRLKRDERYALSTGCKILTQFKTQYAGKFPAWIGMYRAGVRLSSDAVRLSAQRYDTMIRKTVSKMGKSNEQR